MGSSLSASVIVPTLGRVEEALALAARLDVLEPPPLSVIFVFQDLEELTEWQRGNKALRSRGILCSARGAGQARNMGAQVAETEFLAFLDDDCEPVRENWLSELLLPLNREAVILSTGPVHGWTAYTSIFKKSKRAYMLATRLLIPWGNPESRFSGECHTIAGGNFAVRRELFVSNDGFSLRFGSPSLHEETEFAIRVARAENKKIWFAANAPIFHNQKSEGGMRFEVSTPPDDFVISQRALLLRLVGHWSLGDRALLALYAWLRRMRSVVGFRTAKRSGH
jgi:glycosyltransferase involved in cell wall biosynthesis